jgi:hypothetical protein
VVWTASNAEIGVLIVAEIRKEENTPGVLQISELVWQLWESRCIEQGGISLASVSYQHIENVDTSRVVGALAGRQRSHLFVRKFLRKSADPTEAKGFHALDGAPLGSNAAYLVRDHFDDFGCKAAVRIRVS